MMSGQCEGGVYMTTLVGLRIATEAVERLNTLARETRRGKGAVMTMLLLAAEATPDGGLRLRRH
jgi:predicted DNA-binding protein